RAHLRPPVALQARRRSPLQTARAPIPDHHDPIRTSALTLCPADIHAVCFHWSRACNRRVAGPHGHCDRKPNRAVSIQRVAARADLCNSTAETFRFSRRRSGPSRCEKKKARSRTERTTSAVRANHDWLKSTRVASAPLLANLRESPQLRFAFDYESDRGGAAEVQIQTQRHKQR